MELVDDVVAEESATPDYKDVSEGFLFCGWNWCHIFDFWRGWKGSGFWGLWRVRGEIFVG